MRLQPPGSATYAVPSQPAQRQSSGATTHSSGATTTSSGAATKPVASTPDTSPVTAWAHAVAQATANSPQQPKKTPAQVVAGVNNSQIKPIITAMANANLVDQNLRPPLVGTQGLFPFTEGQVQSAKSWNTVQQTTYNMLLNNNYNSHPDQSATAEVNRLNALEPGNANFAAANKAALKAAIGQWHQMGVTQSQLSPIIGAYNKVKQANGNINQINQELQNPSLSHNHAVVSDLNSYKQGLVQTQRQANAQLQGQIETWVTKLAGSSPTAAAVADHTGILAKFGPHDPAFQAAVQNATYDLQVIKPAQQVANTYKTGGAQAAADTLKTVTQNAGDPKFALQIIQRSQGTIDRITRDMGSLAAGGIPTIFGSSPAQGEFNQIYGDLSLSVDAATPIHVSFAPKTSITLGGTEAAGLVGNSIAKNVPKNLTASQAGVYDAAAANAITNGDGAALTLATAAALKNHGDPRVAASGYVFGGQSNTSPGEVASFLLDGAGKGFQGLQSKTGSDVSAFSATSAGLYQLQTTWTPFMTNSGLTKATNGYFADHPDVQQKASAELGTISQDGNAIVEAESAWHTYGPRLAGITGQKDLSTAAGSLTGHDNAAAFAVSQSTRLNTAIANTLFPLMAQLGGESGWESWPGWSTIGSGRSALSALPKAASKPGGRLFSGGNLSSKVANPISLGLSVAGLALTGRNAAANWGKDGYPFLPFGSPQEAMNSIYTTLGFGKYLGETYSGLAKLNGLPNALKYTNSGGVTKFFFGKNAEDLTKSPAFQALGVFYYGIGAAAASVDAAGAFNNDPTSSALDSLAALGNAGNAAKPLLGVFTGLSEGALEEIGFVSSGIGLLATAASLGWQFADASSHNAVVTADNAKFLERSLGLNPGLAQAVAAPLGSSPSLSPALQAYAGANNMTPGQLLLKLNHFANLNRGYLSNIDQFIYQATRMPMQSDGKFAPTAPGDGGDSTIQKIGIENPTMSGQAEWVYEPLPADSLAQLRHWAQVLFGNQLG